MKRRSTYTASVALILLFLLASVSLPGRSSGQTRPEEITAGFEFNRFADPANVPEFAIGPYTGPTAITFDSRGRLFVATYSGKILILLDNDDDGRADEVKTFASGIPIPLGLEFRADGDLFVTSNVLRGAGRILRLRDANGDDVADETVTIVDNLPSAGDHQTDRLKFGPDGLLYFSQGSATDAGTPKPGFPAESPLNAAILRVDVDNPATLSVFATGLRNAFGLAFHPENGELFSTDGGSGEICQSPPCSEDKAPPEEVNWIVASGNYGFPQCEGTPTPDRPGCMGVRPPIAQFPRHLTPTSLAFYTGPQAGEFKNHLLLTLYKNLPNTDNKGGDLRRLRLEGDATGGFRVTEDEFIIRFNAIDPFDGPLATAIDPLSGDIYVARFDPVSHAAEFDQNHFIYRIHRAGSDALPFIGPLRPAGVKAGSGAVTLNLRGRHLEPGAVVLADGAPLTTRQGATIYDLIADLPASLTATPRQINIAVRNPDGSLSNQQVFAVTTGDGDPVTPALTSLFVYKNRITKVIDPVTAGRKTKKLRLVVRGTNFDSGAQLLLDGVALTLDSASATELIGRFATARLGGPGEMMVQVRNSNGRVSNTLKLTIAPSQ
ncbi:MAG TPA: PQQ-dependent sugar dehydrogenase [Blastocatellia bacterium]|nr:PQQ-dependent sugar dehydrogenase [Blastocatellia bacterium]